MSGTQTTLARMGSDPKSYILLGRVEYVTRNGIIGYESAVMVSAASETTRCAARRPRAVSIQSRRPETQSSRSRIPTRGWGRTPTSGSLRRMLDPPPPSIGGIWADLPLGEISALPTARPPKGGGGGPRAEYIWEPISSVRRCAGVG